jgi:V-type H+-transporting ATPase proteolipid subunit
MVLALLAVDEIDYSPYFFAYMGVTSALVFANLGASYGTAKAGVGISSLGVIDGSKVFKGLIPIIMAGILGIYGIIVAVLLNSSINSKGVPNPEKPETILKGNDGYKIFGAGLSCGLSSLAAGLSIGVTGDAGVRAFAQTDGIFVGMILILIFGEAIGLYGLIVAIIMSQ